MPKSARKKKEAKIKAKKKDISANEYSDEDQLSKKERKKLNKEKKKNYLESPDEVPKTQDDLEQEAEIKERNALLVKESTKKSAEEEAEFDLWYARISAEVKRCKQLNAHIRKDTRELFERNQRLNRPLRKSEWRLAEDNQHLCRLPLEIWITIFEYAWSKGTVEADLSDVSLTSEYSWVNNTGVTECHGYNDSDIFNHLGLQEFTLPEQTQEQRDITGLGNMLGVTLACKTFYAIFDDFRNIGSYKKWNRRNCGESCPNLKSAEYHCDYNYDSYYCNRHHFNAMKTTIKHCKTCAKPEYMECGHKEMQYNVVPKTFGGGMPSFGKPKITLEQHYANRK